MAGTKSTSARANIMDIISRKFGSFQYWHTIEPQVALLCTNLPEITDETKIEKFIEGIKVIKKYLVSENIPEDELSMLDDEIEIYRNTKQMSLYVEEDDTVEPEIIDRYARIGMKSEGVVGIHHRFNYAQLSYLTNGVYTKTKLIKFFISSEKKMSGQIVADIDEHPLRVPIATLVESKKTDDSGEPIDKRIVLFGERVNPAKYTKIKEIEIPFFVYRFVDHKNTDYILLSTTKCEIGDYEITGTLMHCDDYKMLTDSAKLPTKLPFIFAQNVKNRVVKFKDHEEFRKQLYELKISKKTLFDYPFTSVLKHTKQRVKLLHPAWFKNFIWAFLLHKPAGLSNTYPLHIFILAKKGTGKSEILNGLYSISKESRPVFSGAGSTMKSLIPAFATTPPKIGYLVGCNRFAFCDELLRCLFNTSSKSTNDDRDESFAMMNNLLEHQKRVTGSGISDMNVNMTARMIGVTNPVRGVGCMEDLLLRMDESFLSRILCYYQDKEHIQLIRNSKDRLLQRYEFTLLHDDWLSIVDYLQSFPAQFDAERVEKIYDSLRPLLSESLLDHYEARHDHHIECLIDGIVKMRCLFEKNMEFKAIEKDYEMLRDIWTHIIKSWTSSLNIKALAVEDRIWHLPEKAQWLYWEFTKVKGVISQEDAWKIAEIEMTHREFVDALVILRDNELVIDEDNDMRVYYMSKGDVK